MPNYKKMYYEGSLVPLSIYSVGLATSHGNEVLSVVLALPLAAMHFGL